MNTRGNRDLLLRKLTIFNCVLIHSAIDHRQCKDQACRKEHPCRNEDVHKTISRICFRPEGWTQEWGGGRTYGRPFPSPFQIPAAPADWMDLSVKVNQSKGRGRRCTGWRTEPNHVGQFRRIVGHGTDQPIRRSLPHCIQKSTEDIKPNSSNIAVLKYIDLGSITAGCLSSILSVLRELVAILLWKHRRHGHIHLVEVCPNMDEEYHQEKDGPSGKGSNSTAEVFSV